MQPSDVKTAADARKIVEARKLDHVKLGVFDVDGVLRGKYLHRDKFFSALEGGFGFCDVVLGWDSNDQLYDNVAFTGWHTAYPDAQCRIVPATCRALPLEGDMLFFLAEFDGEAEALCPRGLLKRVLARAADMGYAATASCEYEFFLFEETPHSVREKGYKNLRNITPGFFGYSLLRASVHAQFYADLLKLCADMRFPLEGLHTETGPGVIEAAIHYADALEGADRAALFKTFVKVLAERRGWMATFMAKWSRDWPGQSGHLHVSLKDKAGQPVFYDADKPMSDAMRWFIGGQQALMPELLALVAAHAVGRGAAPEEFTGRTRAVRGCVRRALRRDARVGGAGIPQGHHRLGTRTLFRDHLKMQLRANWSYPTTVRFGAGRIAELPDAVTEAGMRSPLFVTDPNLAALPMTKNAIASLRGAALFCDIKPNPVEANVVAGIAAFKAGAHDGVVAV